MNGNIFLLHKNNFWAAQIPVIRHKCIRQTSASQERIQFVHSNDASSDHMQMYPSSITSLKLKSLNKSLVIPLRSIQAICSVSLSSILLLFEYWCYDKGEHSSEILSVSWVQIRADPGKNILLKNNCNIIAPIFYCYLLLIIDKYCCDLHILQ